MENIKKMLQTDRSIVAKKILYTLTSFRIHYNMYIILITLNISFLIMFGNEKMIIKQWTQITNKSF